MIIKKTQVRNPSNLGLILEHTTNLIEVQIILIKCNCTKDEREPLGAGSWGQGLDILVDPYTFSLSGAVRIVAFTDFVIGVRHTASFAAMLDALT